MKRILLLVVLLIIADISVANVMCKMTPGGSLDDFQNNFFSQAQLFAKNALPLVHKIYWLLFGLWCLWELAFDRILGFRIDKLYVWWIARIFVAYTIYHIFLQPEFYMGIIKLGAKFGATMGGFAVDPNSSSPLGDFTPSSIMGINSCVAVAIDEANKNLPTFNILGALELWMLQTLFFIVTGMAALYVLYLSIKIWLCLFAGFVNSMFAGNGWTVSWWQAYMGTVIKYALELIFTAALFGMVHNQLYIVLAKLTATKANIVGNYADYILAILSLFFMNWLMLVVPKELASSLGGSFGGKILEVGGTMAMRGFNILRSGAGSVINQGGNTSTGNSGSGVATNSSYSQSGSSYSNNVGSWRANPLHTNTTTTSGQDWKKATDNIKHSNGKEN